MKIGTCSREGRGSGHHGQNEDRRAVSEDLVEAIAEEEGLPLAGCVLAEKVTFVGVFDGHGGATCSEFLARMLPRKVATKAGFERFENAAGVLAEVFEETENEFLELAVKAKEVSGACAVVVLINGLDIAVAHCGDCRAVLRGPKGVIELTKDHRPTRPDEQARIIEAGGTIIGNRVHGILGPSRTFGDCDIKSLDGSIVVNAIPEVLSHHVELGRDRHSFLILATDGVWDAMTSEKAMDIVTKAYFRTRDAEKAAGALVAAASAVNPDDVTVTVVVWKLSRGSTPSRTPARTMAASTIVSGMGMDGTDAAELMQKL